ncbi:terminase [Vitiosangium sp. GDMCC 1.1324]|uniref:terminase n=1 Tax=Vitiosangium sp. (strain GDMCC 1.1324) TaxID=2138576 RepID=UPI000D357CAB|nr:terminase [Vitiosangium sp. GDMCC 1.1324]PTL84101.1 terminase [Vitiosangium sp. GDMCC 1.1324]
MNDDRSAGLLAWQLNLYPDNHRDRRNLLLHAVTVPLFQLGTVLLVTAPFTSLWSVLPGLVAMAGAMALQGRGHRLETSAPVPFRGPLDVIARIFVEQWVTFPRFVLSGGFARMWRLAPAH